MSTTKKYFYSLTILVLYLFSITTFFSSCSVAKLKQSTHIDSSATTKQDSGNVKTSTGNSKEQEKWYKETIIYAKDSSKGNITNVYPTTIIRETGNTNKESSYANKDSGWQNAFSAFLASFSETKKEKKEEVFTTTQLIGIAIIILLIGFILAKIISFNNPFKKVL